MRPEDQSLTRDLSKRNNFYVEYMVALANVMSLFHLSCESDEELCCFFSWILHLLKMERWHQESICSFWSLPCSFSVLSPVNPYGPRCPAYKHTCTVLNAEIQVLFNINLRKFCDVWIWSLWAVVISCKLECEWAGWRTSSFYMWLTKLHLYWWNVYGRICAMLHSHLALGCPLGMAGGKCEMVLLKSKKKDKIFPCPSSPDLSEFVAKKHTRSYWQNRKVNILAVYIFFHKITMTVAKEVFKMIYFILLLLFFALLFLFCVLFPQIPLDQGNNLGRSMWNRGWIAGTTIWSVFCISV